MNCLYCIMCKHVTFPCYSSCDKDKRLNKTLFLVIILTTKKHQIIVTEFSNELLLKE